VADVLEVVGRSDTRSAGQGAARLEREQLVERVEDPGVRYNDGCANEDTAALVDDHACDARRGRVEDDAPDGRADEHGTAALLDDAAQVVRDLRRATDGVGGALEEVVEQREVQVERDRRRHGAVVTGRRRGQGG